MTVKTIDPKVRLRAMLKRLVIELGYLESCKPEDFPGYLLQVVASQLNVAISILTHLTCDEQGEL
ncbi:MAG: hypothetical protein ACFB0C_24555 [Leptolyngbyaceae cyanobacterium]